MKLNYKIWIDPNKFFKKLQYNCCHLSWWSWVPYSEHLLSTFLVSGTVLSNPHTSYTFYSRKNMWNTYHRHHFTIEEPNFWRPIDSLKITWIGGGGPVEIQSPCSVTKLQCLSLAALCEPLVCVKTSVISMTLYNYYAGVGICPF